MELKYVVKENDNYTSISQILKNEFKISSRIFKKLIKLHAIFYNDTIYLKTYIQNLKYGDIILLTLDYPEDNSNIIPTKMDLNIIYEDEWMLVVNKPSGICIHPSASHFSDSLSNGIRFYFDSIDLKKKIRPVTRLDASTSGLVIFAKCEYIHSIFNTNMVNKTFMKKYLAIAEGIFENKSGVISLPIARKKNSIIERCIDTSGQISITKYIVLKEDTSSNYSLVECILETGRTHQIRVHMLAINHPLLGDSLYGITSNLINRQALHSYYISCIHPITKKRLEFISNLPKDMNILFKE